MFRINKYHNKITYVDGIRFMSKRESQRYLELKALERSGIIRDLKLQPRFPLVFNDIKICTYVADFQYVDIKKNCEVVEDVKGVLTAVYRLKKKLMKAGYGIDIQEV